MSSPPTSAAVITGLGTVGSTAPGRDALAEQLATSTVRLTALDAGPGDPPSARERLAAQVDTSALTPWLPPLVARRMSRPSRFAVVAAKLALEDAGLPLAADGRETAVFMATSFGPTDFSERIVRTLYEEGPAATSPSLFTESVANAPAAQVALATGATGANITVTQREAGPLLALDTAAREVRSGRAEVALAGSVDEAAPILHSSLCRFGALAGSRGGDPAAARPFDRRRDGFLLAEGATVVVVESEARARSRGARILARIGPAVAGFDPGAPTTGWSHDPEILARRLTGRLAATGCPPATIDRIVSGASGARDGDRLEGLVLRAVWNGEGLPAVLAPKAVTGEYGGGHLAAAVLAAAGEPFGPTPGYDERDPEIGLAPHDGRALEPPRRTLVSALAVGGAAAWVVLERVAS